MNKTATRWTIIGVIILVGAFISWQWWLGQQAALPADLAYGNGRIEADQIDISTKYPGRVMEILAREGDLVEPGQVLARMDTAELDAQLAKAKAELSETQTAVYEAEARLQQRQSELTLAEQELERALPLVEKGSMAQRTVDQRQSARNTAAATVTAAQAHLKTQAQVVEAARAAVQLIQTQIADSTLKTPVMGRVLYRLAEPGEVLAGGGKVLTLVNLTEIYMEVFLPSAQAHRIAIGAKARIKLDILDFAIPATVSFVSPESQFTPKQVETLSERDKLMFRVKVRIPQELVMDHISEVKTGVRGIAYIKLTPLPGEKPSPWPDFLQQLPPDYKPAIVNSN
jgi:HlyD family secretion protein